MTEPTTTVVPEQAGLPAAVLWDMDGTLVDTEPYWIATEYAMAEKYGGTWSQEQALSLVGNDLLSSGRVLKEAWDLPQSPAEVVEELLDGVVARVEESVPWQPGAPELLAALREAGVPCALVTMSYERFVAPILRHLPPETFRVIVTGDKVEQGKPHPEPWRTTSRCSRVRGVSSVPRWWVSGRPTSQPCATRSQHAADSRSGPPARTTR